MCVCACVCACARVCVSAHVFVVVGSTPSVVVVGRNRHYLCFDMKAFALLWLLFYRICRTCKTFFPVGIMTWMLQMHPGSTF